MTLVTLPDSPAPRSWTPRYIDFGLSMPPAAGGSVLRIDRPGNRYGASFEYPPMRADKAEIFISRFLQGKSAGVRIELPLLVPQGAPGNAVKVNGSGQSGASIAIDGITPGYVIREGFWLTIYDDDGTGYLHRATASVAANGSGQATVAIIPPLRTSFANNATVELAHPTIEGLVEGESYEWQYPLDRLIRLVIPMSESK
jgi:hypothetical protein